MVGEVMKEEEILKSVILETIEELENNEEFDDKVEKRPEITETKKVETVKNVKSNDLDFYLKLRERIVVLFEGLQSPDIVDLEKKLELTIKFLEYVLALIDEELENN